MNTIEDYAFLASMYLVGGLLGYAIGFLHAFDMFGPKKDKS